MQTSFIEWYISLMGTKIIPAPSTFNEHHIFITAFSPSQVTRAAYLIYIHKYTFSFIKLEANHA
jgi:hypothetical protein